MQPPIAVPETITCVDCLGECGRITFRPDDDPFVAGDVVAYRCRDCMDRWDIVLDPEDFDGEAGAHSSSGHQH